MLDRKEKIDMGQGTESCGGYEVEYNPYCNRAAMVANFSCDEEMWLEWVDVFENELWDRKGKNKSKSVVSKSKTPDKTQKAKKFSTGVGVVMICHCGKEYSARQADLNRGWGLSCSKRCAAIRREFGRPAAKKKEERLTC